MSETNQPAHPPPAGSGRPTARRENPESSASRRPARPENNGPDNQAQEPKPAGKKKKHRGGNRRRRRRRPSFAVPLLPESDHEHEADNGQSPARSQPLETAGTATATSPTETRRSPVYKRGQLGRNLSDTSLDSQALLDHRDQPRIKTRRESRLGQSFRPEASSPKADEPPQYSSSLTKAFQGSAVPANEETDEDEDDDRTPLIKPNSINNSHFVRYGTDGNLIASPQGPSVPSSSPKGSYNFNPAWNSKREYNVNNPPSMPGSPKAGPKMGYDDALITGHTFDEVSPGRRLSLSPAAGDAVIDVDQNPEQEEGAPSKRTSPTPSPPGLMRRRTVTLPVEEDVCFPTGGISDVGEEEYTQQTPVESESGGRRRRRRRVWPDLSVLQEWSREEKEERSGGIRAKRISEPMFIGGRLRTRNEGWKHEEEDAPYRFTYFNEEFPSTVHSQTISELVQPGQTFRDLFIPEPPELESDSSDEEDEDEIGWNTRVNSTATHNGHDTDSRKQSNGAPGAVPSEQASPGMPPQKPKEKRYGPKPTFWLDVLHPTDTEMRVIAKAFGIHALTVEDIMMREAREKVELFRHYYFIHYCTFEQDVNSPDYLQPVNMYVVVFREGLLTFHFSMIPHPANVRRRIRQLRDYLILSSDWISYAIIDDITDVFGPLIHSIEEEVDQIDDTILRLHSDPKYIAPKSSKEEESSGANALDAAPSGTDMLRQVGECRKKVMGLYRLLGNKADVIKGFAKRCNEQWEVAPKSEIGLYLGDIQDHILTMTSNLSHYETLLSRAHSNYLAQINIRMNERQEKTADVLGKLTVLGTIVLPMNIICGMWGMNVKVPGQEVDNLYWFWSITAGLVAFAVICFYVAKRVYGIV